MKQARCHGEQPISFGASKALKYCEIQLKYLSSGIEKVIFAVFAFILGKPTKQLPPNRSCSLVLHLHSDPAPGAPFHRPRSCFKASGKVQMPSCVREASSCVAMMLPCYGNFIQLLYTVRSASRAFGLSAFHPICEI